MFIETGSQNASRIPGVYAYPIQRYSSQGVTGVGAIEAKTSFFKERPRFSAEDRKDLDYIKNRDSDLKASYLDRNLHPQGNLFKGHFIETWG